MSVGEPLIIGSGPYVGPAVTPQTGPAVGTPVEVATGGVGRGEFGDLVERVDDLDGRVDEIAARPRDYPHTQSSPSAVWQVPHGLGFRPTFLAFDTEGRPVSHGGNITHPVPGELMEVHFGTPVAGSGYAS